MNYEKPSNCDNIIDSRDVIAYLTDLEDELQAWLNKDDTRTEDQWDNIEALDALRAFNKQGESYAPDWTYGEICIADNYFTEYAQELADDIGAIDRNANWPLCHIDWDAAAESLKQDYTEIEWDGSSYWVR